MDQPFDKVKKIVNEFDPMALLEGGAPKDEHDVEVKQIVECLNSNLTKKQLKEKIQNIFVKSFDPITFDMDEKRFDEMVSRIYT